MLTLAALSTPLVVVAWIALVAAVVFAFVYAKRGARARERLRAEGSASFELTGHLPDRDASWLHRWLFVAGFRRPGATGAFLVAAAVALAAGLLTALTLRSSTLLLDARQTMYDMPGDIGKIIDPLLLGIPWVLGIIIASIPWVIVRSARRRRVREIEEDLPITLQLLSTMAQAGLGLDAALIRVLDSSDETRPLPQELQQFRRENLAGVPRADCWRHLGRRVDLPSVSIFCSAMIHAEQVGGGISEVLAHQTADVQSRRREQALITAQALPVKLVIPLVICFLPGIFVWTLGPAFYQFLQMIEGVLRGATGGAGGLAP